MNADQIRRELTKSVEGLTTDELAAILGIRAPKALDDFLEEGRLAGKIERLGPVWMLPEQFVMVSVKIESTLGEMHAHSPKRKGFSAESILKRAEMAEDRVGAALIERLIRDKRLRRAGDLIATPNALPQLSERRSMFVEALVQLLDEGGDTPPSPHRMSLALNAPAQAVGTAIGAASARGLVRKLTADVVYHSGRLDELVGRLRAHQDSRPFSPRELREALGLSRKYGDAVFDYLEASGIAERRGATLHFAS